MEKEEFKELLKKYHAGTASKEETDFLHAYYRLFEFQSSDNSDAEKLTIKNEIKENLHKAIRDQERKSSFRHIRHIRHIRLVAASVALVLLTGVAGLYLFKEERGGVQTSSAGKPAVADVAPGGNKAILKLGDGRTLALDAAPDGVLAQQGDTEIRKTADGVLEYDGEELQASSATKGSALMNTISTPRGGQYQLTLHDGTKVWLNAASSIEFPTSFRSDRRQVRISGEVYFEVAPDKKRPFLVLSRDQETEVLGTHFNINAYADEPSVTTTLLEGSIRVQPKGAANSASRVLYPGQQSQLYGSSMTVKAVDPEEVIAWKNGYFMFYRADIRSVMRQVARWYNVDVRFEGRMPEDEFVGKIARTEHVSGVLRILELGNISSRIEGRQIIISSNENP